MSGVDLAVPGSRVSVFLPVPAELGLTQLSTWLVQKYFESFQQRSDECWGKIYTFVEYVTEKENENKQSTSDCIKYSALEGYAHLVLTLDWCGKWTAAQWLGSPVSVWRAHNIKELFQTRKLGLALLLVGKPWQVYPLTAKFPRPFTATGTTMLHLLVLSPIMLLWPSPARAAVALVTVSSSLTLSDLCWQ